MYAAEGEQAVRAALANTEATPEDIMDILDKIKENQQAPPAAAAAPVFEIPPPPPPAVNEATPTPPAGKPGKPPAAAAAKPVNANTVYDEYKVEHKNGTKGDKDEHFEKVKKLKTVRIPEYRAARLNAHSTNTKIRYYAAQ